ncbi:MFS transporter [Streptomyces cylindrosporus]|uniref:MFS transporter n=1 Tax=Streptomyces cylindrosporus TaxID=2927583 RepID=A0ABS9YHN0_9ACTN|nr:MFS transporter [Streptomyces cylindrosporus]MCI3276763.1 MFS transporter [Streptomyces cylindrosporus]
MSYRSLLRAAGAGFFPLGLLARLPYATSALSTLILLQTSTHNYAFAGLGGATQSIATALGGPLVGTLADRHGHRVVGVVAAIANFAAWAALLAASLTGGRQGMLVAAALVGLTQPQVGPLVRVHWSRLLHARGERELLPAALSYEASADELSFVAGPVFVGLLTSLSPLAPTIATMTVIAATTLPFAAVYAHPAPHQQPTAPQEKPRLPRRPLAVMFLAMAAMGAVFGSLQTAVTVYADAIDEPGAAGLVYAEFGIGSALAGVACAWLPRQFTLRARYLSFAATLCAGMLVLFVGARLLSLPAAVAAASLTVAPYMISLYALTERLAPAERAAVAMTVLCAGGPLGAAVGQAVSGSLAQSYGIDGALLVAFTAAAAALLLALSAFLADRRRNIWIVDATVVSGA